VLFRSCFVKYGHIEVKGSTQYRTQKVVLSNNHVLSAGEYCYRLQSIRSLSLIGNTGEGATGDDSLGKAGVFQWLDVEQISATSNQLLNSGLGWNDRNFITNGSYQTDVTLVGNTYNNVTNKYNIGTSALILDKDKFNLNAIPTYPNNAAAISGGLVVGDIYKTATGELRIRI
jgi:hypothetical protein